MSNGGKKSSVARWSSLVVARRAMVQCAVFILTLIPVLMQVLFVAGIIKPGFLIPISGAAIYLAVSAVIQWLVPSRITRFRSEDEYVAYCIENIGSISAHDEMSIASRISKSRYTEFFPNDGFLWPFDKGLRIAKSEAVRKYATIEYYMSDNSMVLGRWAITVLLGLSTLAMLYCPIMRVIHAYWRHL